MPINRFDGVIVSVLAQSALVCWFCLHKGQAKDYKICCV